MRKYITKSLFLFIFVCALFAGVCFENTKADASLGSSSVKNFTLATIFELESFEDTEPCVAVKSGSGNAQIQNSFQNNTRRTELKVYNSVLCSDSFLSGGENSALKPLQISVGQKLPKQIMTNYIHQSDGKKRF